MNTPRKLYEKRKARVRTALKAAANGKMRLSVFRSGKHIYAQIIDDAKGATAVSYTHLFIALINYEDGEKAYILAPQRLKARCV